MTQGGTLEAFNELIRIFFLEVDNFRAPEICALNVELISEATRSENVRAYLTGNNQTVASRFEAIIRESQLKGEINPDLEPVAVARVMIALYQGFITQKLVEPNLDPGSYGRTQAHPAAWRTGRFVESIRPEHLRPLTEAGASLS
jgi:hypothetical protein